MCALLSCQGLAKAFGAQSLFSGVTLMIDAGDRVGLIGPNGSGKSTLLKIFCGLSQPDSGTVYTQKLMRISYVAQDDSFDEEAGCADNLEQAVQGLAIDAAEQYNRVHALLSRGGFADADQPVRLLSGGWRKRLSICRALVTRPEVLVMDEPTNHLDMESIESLNTALEKFKGTLVFVSHDREFVSSLATRILEIRTDGSIVNYPGNYEEYLASQGID